MSTKGVMRYDQYLTNVGLAYPVGNLIGKLVAPIIPVDNYSDYVYVEGDDAINQMNDNAEEVPTSTVDFETGTPYTYRTKRRGLNTFVSEKRRRNSKSPINLEIKETNKLTHRLNLMHEKRIVDILTDNSLVTQTADLTGTARWDSSAPDLEATIIAAAKVIQSSTGTMANTIVIPFDAALYAANMSFIKDTLKYQYGMQVVTAQFQRQAMELIGLPPVIKGLKVVIANARINDANKGETASKGLTWGKNCLIGYVPPSVNVETMLGIATMEYEPFQVSRGDMTDPKGVKVMADWDYDILQADLKCWYLLTNVIS